jgi:hypothetical protein
VERWTSGQTEPHGVNDSALRLGKRVLDIAILAFEFYFANGFNVVGDLRSCQFFAFLRGMKARTKFSHVNFCYKLNEQP